jgi:chromosome segregation ATPase
MAVYQPRSSALTPTSEAEESAALRTELGREQERLRKLWDAFKSQEDELTRLRSQPAATTALASTSAADSRAAESMRREVDLLTGDLRRAAESQRRLEEENRELAAQVDAARSGDRTLAGLETELAQERERLAKLYAVYEEVEASRKALEERLKAWDAWYHGMAPHMAEICRSIGGAPR